MHKSSCKVCKSVKNKLVENSLEKVKISEQVKKSGKFNFEGCRIPINKKMDIAFMDSWLLDYQDAQVTSLMLYGFPIELVGENKHLLFSKESKLKNHAGARQFPDQMLKYLEKESKHGAIIGPFSSCPFKEGMVISPLNTVPKSKPGERRVILDLSFPKDGTGVNDFIDKDSYLGDKVELSFPKIDDFIALIKAKGQGCCTSYIPGV